MHLTENGTIGHDVLADLAVFAVHHHVHGLLEAAVFGADGIFEFELLFHATVGRGKVLHGSGQQLAGHAGVAHGGTVSQGVDHGQTGAQLNGGLASLIPIEADLRRQHRVGDGLGGDVHGRLGKRRRVFHEDGTGVGRLGGRLSLFRAGGRDQSRNRLR